MTRRVEALRGIDGSCRKSAPVASDLKKALSAFMESRDTRFHFVTQSHSDALSDMASAIDDADPGIILVSGEAGFGKTLLRTVLSQQLAGRDCVSVSLESGLLGFDDLLLEISSQLLGLRLSPREYPDRYSRLAAYKDALMSKVIRQGAHLALLLDEAQQMDVETLEGVRSLCNIGAERQNYMTPILFGQAGVSELIRTRREIAARIAAVMQLEPLTLAETVSYLSHRLETAGFNDPMPFSDDAIATMHELSYGVPRSLNRLCKMTIRQAMVRNMTVADAACVTDAAAKSAVTPCWPDSCLLSG